MALFGKPNVDKLRENRDVEGLIKALTYNDNMVRAMAAHKLGELSDERAVGPLFMAVTDTNPPKDRLPYHSVQKAAVLALGSLGAVHALIMLCIIANSGVDFYARNEIVKIGRPSVEPLIALLEHQEFWIRRLAIELLGKIGDPLAAEALMLVLSNRTEDRLAKDVRYSAAEALGNIGDARAVDAIIELFMQSFGDQTYHAMAAEALSKFCDEKVVEPFLREIKYGEDYICHQLAIVGLGKIGDPRAVDPLMELFVSKEFNQDQYRQHATDALIKIGPPVIVPLLKIIGDYSCDYELRLRAEKAVIQMCKISVDRLKEAFKHEDENVRNGAEHVLSKLGLI